MKETRTRKNKYNSNKNRYFIQEKILGKNSSTKLKKARVVIVGVGALGTVVAELLTRAGIGMLILFDYDKVELKNLHRQMIFDENDIGKSKVISAKKKLKKINKNVKIIGKNTIVTSKNLNILKQKRPNLIIDCVDNLQTKLLLNDFSVKNKIPLIHGAAIGERGVVFVVKNSPCLRCIYDENKIEESCSNMGVSSAITTIVGSLQFNEAIKIMTNKEHEKNLMRIDLKKYTVEKIKIKRKCYYHT